MTIDIRSVDEALATTRAVRRRLDLARPVDLQILLDCIDVAEQAPSGGNQGSRRWIVVRDQQRKDHLAELYLESAGRWMIEARDALAGTGHPQERVMASAAHLAEHLAEVPAIVIPTVIGRHDGSGRPGLFDSVIQSVWSFCVALRARGLGTAWTTAALSRERDIAALLGIPEELTQIALIPVAWTVGTEFRRAPRHPAREITYLDTFARTWRSGPSDPPGLADGPGTVVELDIKAPPAVVWPHVSDLHHGAAWQGTDGPVARWADGVTDAGIGARLVIGEDPGAPVRDAVVDRYEPGVRFGWTGADGPEPDAPSVQRCFELEAIAGATRLRITVVLGPGAGAGAAASEDGPDRIDERLGAHHAAMGRTAQLIRAAAEADAAEARAARRATSRRPPLS